ncbi:MAG: PspC domain-containing protein [Anaerolineales bacterium]
MKKNTRLYRSRSNRMLGGVCGGLGTYLNMDPTIVRLLFLLLLFGSDFGFLLYLVLWILVPEEGQQVSGQEGGMGSRVRSMGDDIQQAVAEPHPQAGILFGAGMIIIGGILFLNRLDIPFLSWLDFDVLWPLILIVGGVGLLVRQLRVQEGEDDGR